jgi:hypothetical protein
VHCYFERQPVSKQISEETKHLYFVLSSSAQKGFPTKVSFSYLCPRLFVSPLPNLALTAML